MNRKLLLGITTLLAAACSAQAAPAPAKDAEPAPTQDLRDQENVWIEGARRDLVAGSSVTFRDFDALFNDEFFGRKFDPFAEIDAFQRRVDGLLNDRERSSFGRSWNDWAQERLGTAGIRQETTTTDKEVILSFEVPGLDGGSLAVDVNDDRIRIAYDAKTVHEEKDAATGADARSESARHFEKIVPVPEAADPRRRRIERAGNSVKIVFEKRALPSR